MVFIYLRVNSHCLIQSTIKIHLTYETHIKKFNHESTKAKKDDREKLTETAFSTSISN